jgi:hypothetical protein
MKNSPTPWTRLVAAARLAPADGRETVAPAGFATRVSALALAAGEPAFSALFARFSLRALGVCGLVMVLGVTLNLGSVLNAFESPPLETTTLDDPVSEWLDASVS